jgi:SAM-dependent methyltransferase
VSESDRERWDRRYRERAHPEGEGPDWLREFEGELPKGGRALDVATGTGRVALWLARAGFRVTAVDVSPVGLERLHERARSADLQVETRVSNHRETPLPTGPFEVITCFAYLQRDLFPQMAERLSPGGVLICEIPTRRNLERHAKPSARFLLEENELLELCGSLRILHHREGWIDDRCLARLIGRNDPGSGD